jgi:hypothetical protein
MPLFSLDIEKEFGGEFWTNRYILSATDITLAILSADAIWPLEQNIHKDVVNFTRYRVSDMDPATDMFVIVPIGETGAVTATTGLLPLFNVMRVDFPAGTGRPSRKYLRLPIQESEQEDGVFTTSIVSTVNDVYGNALAAISAFVDVDGEPLGNGRVTPAVAMRQLRRGSRRRTTPVLG